MTNDDYDVSDLDSAIAEHIRGIHGEGMLTGFYLVAEFIDSDGDECWFTKSPERQTLTRTLGLMAFARADIEHQTVEYLKALAEDDD
jgi:hypothetical protein